MSSVHVRRADPARSPPECTQLGEPLVQVHAAAWGAVSDGARFYRRCFRAAFACHELCYANGLRSDLVAETPDDLKAIINTTGHSASAVGHFVAVIGGWRPSCPLPHLHVFVVDVRGRAIRIPELIEGSARPQRRMRHASAVVATPPWAALPPGAPAALPSILVLGGACDGGASAGEGDDDGPPPDEERGTPVRGGLLRLTLLSFCDTEGSRVVWREVDANGSAPAAIWHHQCGSYHHGTRVVVFGGDMPRTDPEFEHIADRSGAHHVYVLDVAARHWDRVSTRASPAATMPTVVPAWRSLHVGLTCQPFGETDPKLLVLGGSDEHVQPFCAPLPRLAGRLDSASSRVRGAVAPMPIHISALGPKLQHPRHTLLFPPHPHPPHPAQRSSPSSATASSLLTPSPALLCPHSQPPVTRQTSRRAPST